MLHLAISFAKKDLFIDKKMQWKMSQNSEQLAGNVGKVVYCDFGGNFWPVPTYGTRRHGMYIVLTNGKRGIARIIKTKGGIASEAHEQKARPPYTLVEVSQACWETPV